MAVGFEFAIQWRLVLLSVLDRILRRPGQETGVAVVARGTDWDMTVDNTEIEYQVGPFEESRAGHKQLKSVMKHLYDFMKVMNSHNSEKRVASDAFPRDMFQLPFGSSFFIRVGEYSSKPIAAIPQVTAGVRLARIEGLWRLLANTDSQAAKQFFADDRRRFYAKVLKPIAELNWDELQWRPCAFGPPSPELKGLITLIATYLVCGMEDEKYKKGPVALVKFLFFLMSRTKFSRLFQSLPPLHRDYYKEYGGCWVNVICRDVMGMVLEKPNGVDPDKPVIEREVNDKQPWTGGIRAKIPITRKEWLTGMLQGKDLLSAEAHPLDGTEDEIWRDVSGLHRLRGLAGLGNRMDEVDYNGETVEAAIIEFRARQDPLLYTDWPNYALRMFRFFERLNQGDADADVTDLTEPGEES